MPENRPQVAFFLPHLGGGGTEKMTLMLVNGLAARGYKVDMVLVRSEGLHLELLAPEIRRIDLRANSSYFALPALVSYLRGESPQVLVSALDLTNLLALIARRLSGTRPMLAIRIENMLSAQHRNWWKKRLEKTLLSWLYPRADKIIAVSQAVADEAAKYTGIDPARIQVIYNPVLAVEKSPSEDAHTHRWLDDGCHPVILGVGRLTAQKDFATLLRAFAEVRRSREAHLVILGEGEQRGMLTALASELKIQNDVDMRGFVSNAQLYMERCKVFVLSSIYEGLPTVLIEALASGCPVVSTDCPGGSREILANGAYGELVPTGDPQALARAICRILDGDRKRVDPGWLSQFDLRHAVDEFIRVLGLAPKSN